jgi:hypothetical protein
MTGWYERRQRADTLAASLREILSEADDLAGLAHTIDLPRAVVVMLEGSARDLRDRVADLIDELRADLEPAASGFDPDRVAWGCPASPERVARLLSIHDEQS